MSRNSAFASFGIQQSNEISFFSFVEQNVPFCGAFRCKQLVAVVYAHILDRFCWIANMYDCHDVITHGPIRKEIHSKICLAIPPLSNACSACTSFDILSLCSAYSFWSTFARTHTHKHLDRRIQRDAGYNWKRPDVCQNGLGEAKAAAQPQKHFPTRFMNEIFIARFWRSARANINQCQYSIPMWDSVSVCMYEAFYPTSTMWNMNEFTTMRSNIRPRENNVYLSQADSVKNPVRINQVHEKPSSSLVEIVLLFILSLFVGTC